MKKRKDIKSFIREEDGKTIKKSLLISSLWLVLWFWIANTAEAWRSYTDNHNSWTNTSSHTSTHSNHSSHSSY